MPSTVVTLVTASDLSKKAARPENNVIIQQADGTINPNNSANLVKLVAPPSNYSSPASSIKMLSSGDVFSSALRVPTKIHLTKPLFVSSAHNKEKSSSLISTVPSHAINQEQSTLSSSSTATLLDIPVDMTEKQQQQQQQHQQKSVADYHPSTTLPPTPPPPIVDQTHANTRVAYSHLSHGINRQEQPKTVNTSTHNQGRRRKKSILSLSLSLSLFTYWLLRSVWGSENIERAIKTRVRIRWTFRSTRNW